MKLGRFPKYLAVALLAAFAGSSCESVDDNRIPPVRVYLNFGNTGLWDVYGVSGYGDYAIFSRKDRIPGNYSYRENDYTGFGGVLLIYGVGEVLAYDRACPVEARQDVVVTIDNSNYEAVCRTCGSRFNVCEAYGSPIAGPAIENGYGMRRVNVIPSGGGYIIQN